MRAWILASIVVAGCAASAPEPSAEAATIDGRWTLAGHGEGIGVLGGAIRCANTLLVADWNGGIRALDLESGTTAPTIGGTTLALAIAGDCANRVVYALGPTAGGFPRRRGMVLRGFDMGSGRELVAHPLDLMMMPAVIATVRDGTFVVGGLWMPVPDREYRHPPAAEFYRDKKIGVAIDLASGEWRTVMDPYDLSCPGGGRCVDGSLLPVDGHPTIRWVAAQPASTAVALAGADFTVQSTIDISSPRFRRDGRVSETADAEASMRWASSNSLIRMVVPIGGLVATVFNITRLPDGYAFGQPAEFDWWMNVHALDGRLVRQDVRLPGMPIGSDADGIFLAEYGAGGRLSSPDAVAILRVGVAGPGGAVSP